MLKVLLSLILALGFPFMALADTNSASSVGIINALGTTNTNTNNTYSETLVSANIMSGKQGTQVVSDSGNGLISTTTTLYTVPVGKTLYIQSAWINALGDGVTADFCNIAIYNTSSVYVNSVIGAAVIAATAVGSEQITASQTFPSPVNVPSSYYIKVLVANANTNGCQGGFTGYYQ